MLNQSKERKGLNQKKEDDPKKIKCFRCQEMGHHQKECVNQPICYKCKEEGHMAAECVEFHAKSKDLEMFGFALPEQGFYSITIAGEDECQKVACIIQVLS
jgi:hypothetical protein